MTKSYHGIIPANLEYYYFLDFNHPLTLLDLQLIKDELSKRPNEDRAITIVCLSKKLAVDPQIDEWNKKHPVNKLKIIELKTSQGWHGG